MAEQKKQTQERTLERDEDADFWKVYGRVDVLSTPEGKFCKAVIDLAIWDIQSYFEGKRTAKKRLMIDAVDYVNGVDRGARWPFDTACEVLSLSPHAVRDALYKKFEIDKLMQSSGMLL